VDYFVQNLAKNWVEQKMRTKLQT